jgi:hypothetical protein
MDRSDHLIFSRREEYNSHPQAGPGLKAYGVPLRWDPRGSLGVKGASS